MFSEEFAANTSNRITSDSDVQTPVSKAGFRKKIPSQFLKKAVLLCFSLLLSLYFVEVTLSFFPTISSQNQTEIFEHLARKRGLPFDRRERWEVVRDLRSTGESWYPSVSPTMFMGGKYLSVAGNSLLPLGGVANANILYCNESGSYATYTSDEYGFHNPRNIWQGQAKLDNVFVGDSFTNGSCVKQGEGFVDRIRQIYPSTVNLAATGNGPLTELASIKEYLKDRKLGYVFWVYFEENDPADLYEKESKEPILMRYLSEDDFSQRLIPNREAINAQMIVFVDEQLESAKRGQTAPPPNTFTRHLMFGSTKEALFKLKNSFVRRPPVKYDLDLFRAIMTKGKTAVEQNGGKLVFVYLPEYGRYNGRQTMKNSAAHMKNDVIGLVNSLGIDIIDIDSAFTQLEDPRAVFTFGVHSHYNSGGNLIIAGEILRYLNQQSSKGALR
jgi:hypothetical protein